MTDRTRESLGRVVSDLYAELRRIAHRHLQRRAHAFETTLATTALVNEAYLKLADQSSPQWRDDGHFLALASRVMRHILIDRARARLAGKRGGGRARVTLEDETQVSDRSLGELIDINEALAVLETVDARLARVVNLRFFAGYSEEEIAEALHVTVRTVQRDWKKARPFLLRALSS
jgi:RNA polymerase sigma factor (TIGR02999 family)